MFIQASGIAELGLGDATVRMTQDQADIKIGIDGAAVPSVVPGDQGEIDIEVFQTSTLHQQLLLGYNACKVERDLGIIQPWFATSIFLLNTATGTSHTGIGCGWMKVPDTPYGADAQKIKWTFKCCAIINQ
jgi:hypothetical protein